MGKDYIVGQVYVEYNDPIYDIAFPQMSGAVEFQVFEDYPAVRWSGEPEANFHRLSNGMYLHTGSNEERFWKDVYTALKVNTSLPIARYMPAGPKRDAMEREIKRRGGAVRVREGTSIDGLYYHDEMLKDLGAMIVKAIRDPNRKASERRSKRALVSLRGDVDLTPEFTLPGFKYFLDGLPDEFGGHQSRYGIQLPPPDPTGRKWYADEPIGIHDRVTGEIHKRMGTHRDLNRGRSWFEISWQGKRIDLEDLINARMPDAPSQRCACRQRAVRKTTTRRR